MYTVNSVTATIDDAISKGLLKASKPTNAATAPYHNYGQQGRSRLPVQETLSYQYHFSTLCAFSPQASPRSLLRGELQESS